MSEVGVKYDSGKRDWSLLPWAEVEEVVKVLEFGAKKYSPDNWKKIDNIPDRYFNAAMRHLIAYREGERTDQETGESHLASVICCCLFMMWKDNRNLLKNLDPAGLGFYDSRTSSIPPLYEYKV